MSQDKTKITTFEDLVAWQESRELAKMVYVLTRNYPKDELYALTSQLRRAVVSVSSNIAEGFSRNTASDRTHFYTMARGSLTEVQSQLIISKDLDYISEDEYKNVRQKAITCHKLVTGLINATKRKNS